MQLKKILKRYCYNCKKKLELKTCWYFFNDKVFCSVNCRSNIISMSF